MVSECHQVIRWTRVSTNYPSKIPKPATVPPSYERLKGLEIICHTNFDGCFKVTINRKHLPRNAKKCKIWHENASDLIL